MKKVIVSISKEKEIAVCDLSGRILKVFHPKDFNVDTLIKEIIYLGTPCIVISEKKNSTIKEFSKELNIPLVIENPEKREGGNVIALALNFLKKHAHVFEEIDKILAKMGLEEYAENAKELVLKSKASTPFQAIEKAISFPKIEEMYKQRIEELEKEVEMLKKEVKKEKKLREKTQKILELIIEEREIEKEGLIPVVKIEKFSMNYISFLRKNIRIFKKPVAIEEKAENVKAANYLAKLYPRVVIGDFSENVKKVFLKERIPFLLKENAAEKLVSFSNFYGIEPETLKQILVESGEKSFFEWLSMYRKRVI